MYAGVSDSRNSCLCGCFMEFLLLLFPFEWIFKSDFFIMFKNKQITTVVKRKLFPLGKFDLGNDYHIPKVDWCTVYHVSNSIIIILLLRVYPLEENTESNFTNILIYAYCLYILHWKYCGIYLSGSLFVDCHSSIERISVCKSKG